MSNFSSPNATANEVDQSFPTSDGPSGGAILVGTTPKGPAYRPTYVRDINQFRAIFGDPDPIHPSTMAAQAWLQNGVGLRMVRVLGNNDGTNVSNGYSLGGITGISDTSGSNSTTGSILAVIHHSGTSAVVSVTGVPTDANRFVVTIGTAFAATASFVTSSSDYISKVLNTDPTKYSTYGHYLAEVYKFQPQAASASWWKASILSASWKTFDRDHEPGYTTWVKSQPLGGVEFDLFRFQTLADGRATNDSIKVTIANIRPSANPTVYPYGTFDVLVRDFSDNDQRPVVLETFAQLTLDPEDPNFILRRIGNIKESFDDTERKFVVTEGEYLNRSQHIRVELNSAANYPPEALPWGFRGFPKTRFSGSSTIGANKVPDLPYTVFQRDAQGNYNTNVCWGVLFLSGGVADRMRAFPDLSAGDAWMTGSDADFSLKGLTTYSENGQTRYYWTASTTTYQPLYVSGTLQKFTVPFRGGFDGWDLRVANPTHPDELSNAATESTHAVTSLIRALDTTANPDFIDGDILATPGIHNKKVTDRARTIANTRKDIFYVMDITGSTVTEAESYLTAREIDDNYTAAYYPSLKMENPSRPGQLIKVPASVGVLGALAYTDRTAQPFFAPAGLTRGGLSQFGIKDVTDRLEFKDRDRLYEARINPIGYFTREGVVVFGQKTLQARPSALDRVNVRRLLIKAKKEIMAVARNLVFEPNNTNTWGSFVRQVNPILEGYRRAQGIERFRVVMDSTTTTPQLIDQNAIYGKIFLQPTKTAEFIAVDFIVSNAGVSFGS
jgi:hypothetical protein